MSSFKTIELYSHYAGNINRENSIDDPSFEQKNIHTWPFFTPFESGYLSQLNNISKMNDSFYLVRDGLINILKHFHNQELSNHQGIKFITHFDIYKCLPQNIKVLFCFYHFSFKEVYPLDEISDIEKIFFTDIYSYLDFSDDIERKIKHIKNFPINTSVCLNLSDKYSEVYQLCPRNELLDKIFRNTLEYNYLNIDYCISENTFSNVEFTLDINRLFVGYSFLESHIIGEYSQFTQPDIPNLQRLTPIKITPFSPYAKMQLYTSEEKYTNTDFYQNTQFKNTFNDLIELERINELYFLIKKFVPSE